MPLLQLYSSAEPKSAKWAETLLKDLSSRVSAHLGKSESYVMTCFMPRTTMTMGGTTEPAAYVAITNVGSLSADLTRAMSADLTAVVGETLGVPKERVYIEFSEHKPHLWGFNGETLG